MAQYRLARENDGDNDEVKESVFVGLKQAISDPKVWLLVLILTGAVVSMSFTCQYSCFRPEISTKVDTNVHFIQTFSRPSSRLLGIRALKPSFSLRRLISWPAFSR